MLFNYENEVNEKIGTLITSTEMFGEEFEEDFELFNVWLDDVAYEDYAEVNDEEVW